ncbi:MAG: hypothetical protein ACOC7U_11180, partial [Spirochaetota bacterium]
MNKAFFIKVGILALAAVLGGAAAERGFSQQESGPGYSFILFDANYSEIINSAESAGYRIAEQEITSGYGKYLVSLQKQLEFYTENIGLFFNQEKQLIFFSARFALLENQSPDIVDRLAASMKNKLTENYGQGQKEAFPYYREYQNKYVIALNPHFPSSTSII